MQAMNQNMINANRRISETAASLEFQMRNLARLYRDYGVDTNVNNWLDMGADMAGTIEFVMSDVKVVTTANGAEL